MFLFEKDVIFSLGMAGFSGEETPAWLWNGWCPYSETLVSHALSFERKEGINTSQPQRTPQKS